MRPGAYSKKCSMFMTITPVIFKWESPHPPPPAPFRAYCQLFGDSGEFQKLNSSKLTEIAHENRINAFIISYKQS